MQIEMKTVTVLTLTNAEAERVLENLEDVLCGKRSELVHLNSEKYRNLWMQLTRRPMTYTLTWTEALRVRAYLVKYFEKEKQHEVRITQNVLRDFPIYR